MLAGDTQQKQDGRSDPTALLKPTLNHYFHNANTLPQPTGI